MTTPDDYAAVMKKREQFAMSAMQGLLSNASIDDLKYSEIAHDAVCHADALIAALNKPTKTE